MRIRRFVTLGGFSVLSLAALFFLLGGSATPTPYTVTAFVRTLLDDLDASGFMTTLGFSTYSKTLIDDADAGLARATLSTQKQAWIDVTEHPYHAPIDGTTDATTAITSAINAATAAGGGTVFLPKGTYLWDFGSYTPIELTADLAIEAEPGTVIQMDHYMVLAADAADAALTLQANVARGDVTMTVDDASAISAGDIIAITTTNNIGPGNALECIVVRSVSANVLTFEEPLNLSFATTDSGLSIKAYNKRWLTVRNVHFKVDAACNVQFKYFNGLRLENCTFENTEVTSTNSLITGCANVYATNTTYRGGWYGAEIATARGVVFDGVFAVDCAQHPIAPGYGTVGFSVNNLISRGCGSAIDSHFAFNVGYSHVDANDDGSWNLRGLGKCYLRNAVIRVTNNGGDVVRYIGQPTAITSGDATSIYAATDMVWDNVKWVAPNILGTDENDYVMFHYGQNAILNNVTVYRLGFYAVGTYNGFDNIQITNSRIGRVQFGGGHRITLANNVFKSPIDGNDAVDWALKVSSQDACIVTGNVFQDYNSVIANYSADPIIWTGNHMEDCNNFSDKKLGAGTHGIFYFSNCVFEDVNNISTHDVIAQSYAINCRFTGTTEAFDTVQRMGPISIRNGSTSAGYVDLYEDSDNGTSYARVTLGTNLAANHTVNIESSEKLLGSGTALMQAGDAKTTIYTVPTSLSAIVTKIIVRNPSASLAGGSDFDLGDGANADTWKQNNDLSSMTATTDCIVIFPTAKFTVFNAADAFGIKPGTGATADATATVMVYGVEF